MEWYDGHFFRLEGPRTPTRRQLGRVPPVAGLRLTARPAWDSPLLCQPSANFKGTELLAFVCNPLLVGLLAVPFWCAHLLPAARAGRLGDQTRPSYPRSCSLLQPGLGNREDRRRAYRLGDDLHLADAEGQARAAAPAATAGSVVRNLRGLLEATLALGGTPIRWRFPRGGGGEVTGLVQLIIQEPEAAHGRPRNNARLPRTAELSGQKPLLLEQKSPLEPKWLRKWYDDHVNNLHAINSLEP